MHEITYGQDHDLITFHPHAVMLLKRLTTTQPIKRKHGTCLGCEGPTGGGRFFCSACYLLLKQTFPDLAQDLILTDQYNAANRELLTALQQHRMAMLDQMANSEATIAFLLGLTDQVEPPKRPLRPID